MERLEQTMARRWAWLGAAAGIVTIGWLVMPGKPIPALSTKPVLVTRPVAPTVRVPARRPCVPAEAAIAAPSGSARVSCLLHAAAFELVDVVGHFLAEGVDAAATDAEGNTALMMAAAAGKTEVVRMLLADPRGRASLSVVNSVGETALTMALRRKHVAVGDLLLQHDAGRSLGEGEARALVDFALKTCHASLLAAAVAAQASASPVRPVAVGPSFGSAMCDERVLASFRQTLPADDARALSIAIRGGNLAAVNLLLDDGVSAQTPARDSGMSPLGEAILHVNDGAGAGGGRVANRAREAIVMRLLAAGFDVNGIGRAGGETPLMLAAYVNSVPVARMLLDRDLPAQIDQRSDDGLTALMVAAKHGHLEVVRLLLGPPRGLAAADKTLRNRRRETAADLAEAAGHQALAKMLR